MVTSSKSNNKHLNFLNKKKFLTLINNTQVVCESNLILNGTKKNAINYPFKSPPVIKLDCDYWKNINNYQTKARLVAHEYLHLMLVDDSTYIYSNQLIYSYNQEQFELDIEIKRSINLCDIKLLNDSSKQFPNLYFVDENNESYITYLLQVEQTTECPEILNILTEFGVPFGKTDKDKKIFFEFVIKSFVRNRNSLDLTDKIRADKRLKIIQSLISYQPELLEIRYNENIDQNILRFFPISSLCLKDASPLDFIQSGQQFYLGSWIEKDLELENLLIETGFKGTICK